MTQSIKSIWHIFSFLMQRAAFVAILAAGIGIVGYTAACLLGFAPWFAFEAQFGETVYSDAGLYAQGGLTALALALCFYLPGNARIMALETSHRSFTMGMQDVARAYTVSHAQDRESNYKIASEFDSIRARMAFLRDHPDLTELEPSVLEVASQMSHVSSELADLYSDAKVARARDFLFQRQQEIAQFNDRLERAKLVATDMRRWMHQVEMDESVAQAQLDRLRDELFDVLPEVAPEQPEKDDVVVPITQQAAE